MHIHTYAHVFDHVFCLKERPENISNLKHHLIVTDNMGSSVFRTYAVKWGPVWIGF